MNYIWTTQFGEKIPLKDMSDRHLINAIRFLDRNCVGVDDWIPDFNESDRHVFITRKEELTESGYFKLLAETRKRGIIIPKKKSVKESLL